MIGIILALALSQTLEPTVTVVHSSCITTAACATVMKRSDVVRLLATTNDQRTRQALELALMVRSHHCDHTPKDGEDNCFDK